jgi:hypothetical protein
VTLKVKMTVESYGVSIYDGIGAPALSHQVIAGCTGPRTIYRYGRKRITKKEFERRRRAMLRSA